MKIIKISILLWLIQINIFPKTILISDIDDTLKNSHVRCFSCSIARAFSKKALFKSMPYILRLFSQNYTPIYYLSNAPKALMYGKHNRFLNYNNFPKGKLYLRKNLNNKDFKFDKISKILRIEKPDILILIGDNGNEDPEVFQQIIKSFPFVKIFAYIRTLNKIDIRRNYSNIKRFVSPMELMVSFNEYNLITGNNLERYIKKYGRPLFNEILELVNFLYETPEEDRSEINPKARFLPQWINCEGYESTYFGRNALVNAIKLELNILCENNF